MSRGQPYCGALFLVLLACQSPSSSSEGAQSRRSVSAEINKAFRDDKLDVRKWVERYEAESREIFQHKDKIAAALQLQPGMAVADIGAGTGFFSVLFHHLVGDRGRVYAVELAPAFRRHLAMLRSKRNLENLVIVACDERSTQLAPASIDVAFVCDTYHHFEFHRDTLRSIRSALRPHGQLVVVDFERIPGVSRKWVVDHVRAGKDVFRREIEEAGFVFLDQVPAPYLAENYILRFWRGS